MPYKSKAQAAYFHAHKKELQRQGVNVKEWDRASKGKKTAGAGAEKGKMTGVRVDARTVLLIPDGWTAWVHNGVLYRRTNGTIYRCRHRMFSETPTPLRANRYTPRKRESLSLHV